MKRVPVRLGGVVVGIALVMLLVASAASAGVNKECFEDQTFSVSACFYEDFLQDGSYYDVTNFHFTLTLLDASVQVKKAVVNAGVSGYDESGRLVLGSQSKTFTDPTFGNSHFFDPSWTGLYLTFPAPQNYDCGNLFVYLNRRGYTYTWTMHTPSNVCIGGAPPVIGPF